MLEPPYPVDLPGDVHEFLRVHGNEQRGCPVPPAWRRRRMRAPGGCYAGASRWAMRDAGALYTEGVALARVGWIPHAWLTIDGRPVDLSWDDPAETYRGVMLPARVAAQAGLRLGHHGPLLPIVVRAGWRPGDTELRRQGG